MNKAVFLDRDGVLNEEIGDYVFRVEDFEVVNGIIEVLGILKKRGFLLVVITNQAGIARGFYTHEDVQNVHAYFQEQSGGLIDKYYYAPGHPDFSNTLSRKPGSLLFEKAIARFNIDPEQSWMIGDRERDLVPAKKLGMKTIRISTAVDETIADYRIDDVRKILDEIR